MSTTFTRRSFLGDAAMAGMASALRLEPSPEPHISSSNNSQRRMSFDEGWRFCLGDPAGAQIQSFDDRRWRQVRVPHDWSIEGTFSEDAPAKGNGGYLPTGVGWYRKAFTLPRSTAGKRISVTFDGVYQRSEVWVNGVSLGMRPYGFTTFSYELTPHLAAAGMPNVMAVRVDNSLQPNSRWYTGSGIYRHTWLQVTERLHLAHGGVFVSMGEVSQRSATVLVMTRVQNDSESTKAGSVWTELLDPQGKTVAESKSPLSLDAGREGTYSCSLAVPSPSLWSPVAPALYQVRSTISENGNVLDQDTSPFGIREAVFDADQGLLLNGERVKMNGVCLHGDGGAVGTAVPEGVWERRLLLLKEMGCNAVRLAHNPPAPELLDMLDRMGFLVMAEAFDEWRQPKAQTPVYGYHRYFDEWSERDLTAMIERDRNHPCIVIWSLGNEVPDQTDPEGPATLQRLKQIARRSDSTRPFTVACDDIAAEPRATLPAFLAELDVVGYNYVDRWRDRREKFYSIDRHAFPGRRFIGTESTAVFGARGAFEVDQRNAMFFERASNTEVEVEQLQKFIQTYDYVSGDFIWTGIDYLGEARWPNKLAATGPLDTCGFKKDNFFFYQSLWTDQPVLHLSPHWNWSGREGKVVTVTCFTNCETVELFLNGESLGTKGFSFPRPGMTESYGHYPPSGRALQTTADLHLSWDVPYAPGLLSARGMKDGTVVTHDVHTTGRAAALSLTADRNRIRTDPADVAHVTVLVLDSDGRVVPTADNPVSFVLQGEGILLGLDNGRPDSHEAYHATSRTTFNGMALAIVQSTGRAGPITLIAEAPGLVPARVRIEASATA